MSRAPFTSFVRFAMLLIHGIQKSLLCILHILWLLLDPGENRAEILTATLPGVGSLALTRKPSLTAAIGGSP